jgi:hypothetical protein
MLKALAVAGFAAAWLFGAVPAHAAETSNSLTFNALTFNALTFNALTSNAITINALTINGGAMQGTGNDAALQVRIVAVELPSSR